MLLWACEEPRGGGSVKSNAEDLQGFLEERERSWKQGGRDDLEAAAGALVRAPMTPAETAKLFAMPNDEYTHDPHSYYRYEPGLAVRRDWPEHPDGFYVKQTNAMGLREDLDAPPDDLDLFVLVAGDSHTDGVCNNDESFANVLQAMLSERHPDQAIEVWNTGVTGQSLYNYLGNLEKFVDRDPAVFVATVYGGNDFLDLVRIYHFFNHTSPPTRRHDYWDRVTRAGRVASYAVAIALNQALYFQYHPDQVDVALRAARQVTAEMKRICDERGIQLVFVYIPPGIDLGGEVAPEVLEAYEILGLGENDLRSYDRLADRWLADVGAWDIPVIDLRGPFAEDVAAYYWSDLHINLAGHRLVAEQLLPLVEAAWRR